jgi:hypothetical protein
MSKTKKKAVPKSAAAKPKAKPTSKTEAVIALLKRPDGATLAEIVKSTSWQAHSVRGFISGTLGKKLGLKVASSKDANGARRYAL